MARFAGIGVFGFALLALWMYAIFDVISTEDSLVRNLPKTLWLMVVIFVPTVGAIAWLALGRPLYAGFMPGDTRSRAKPAPRRADDDPNFMARPSTPAADPSASDAVRERRLAEREAELKRREEELERRRRELGEG